MKLALFLFIALCTSYTVHAELRIIGIEITSDKNQKVSVSIFSDVETEHKKDISIAEASKILSEAEGWGSLVYVGIVAHRISVSEYLHVIKTISENAWLDLAFIEGKEPNFIFVNIKKRIEQEH